MPTDERIRCSYAERNCLRRDADGMIPARDENGRQLYETCDDCGYSFCLEHRHTTQSRRENMCEGHGRYHPRCVLTSRCEDCGHRFCEGSDHLSGGMTCLEYQDQDNDEDFVEDDGGRYNGPYREAELLFEGDTPVAGVATGERYVSFEVEAEIVEVGGGQFVLPEKFGITGDGSLYNGVEVTFPPSRMDALVENAETVTSALREGGYGITSRCGMHMHLDLRDKVNDSTFLSHLFATLFAVEDILFAMQGSNRASNSYCVPMRQGWKFYDAYGQKAEDFDFTYYKMEKSLANKASINNRKRFKGGPRYNAFNFHSVWYRGTLEVRLHEGCLDSTRMLLWAELFQHIVARVEKGITYPALLRLLEMDVSPEKLALFGRMFGLPASLLEHVTNRIMRARGTLSYRIPFTLGFPRKGRAKALVAQKFKATHRSCRWCGAVVRLTRRCSYCRRDPSFEMDEMGLRDVRGMLGHTRYDRYGNVITRDGFISEEDWRIMFDQVNEPLVEFAAITDDTAF